MSNTEQYSRRSCWAFVCCPVCFLLSCPLIMAAMSQKLRVPYSQHTLYMIKTLQLLPNVGNTCCKHNVLRFYVNMCPRKKTKVLYRTISSAGCFVDSFFGCDLLQHTSRTVCALFLLELLCPELYGSHHLHLFCQCPAACPSVVMQFPYYAEDLVGPDHFLSIFLGLRTIFSAAPLTQ